MTSEPLSYPEKKRIDAEFQEIKRLTREMVQIPEPLSQKIDGLGPHFCLVKARDKDPSVGGPGWQKPENLMRSTDSRLIAHLAGGGNYGIVGGFGLTIAEADSEELKDLLESKLPETFTVLSPGHQGYHCYFLCGLEKPIRLRDKNGENVGDIQGPGKMVVGPESIHPNGGVYRVIKDLPLAQVTKGQLVEALKEYVIPDREIEQIESNARQEKKDSSIDLDICSVVPLSGLQKRGNEYFGAHPVHGSETGQNFWVNPPKNCWHCFRHGTGGGPLTWLAVESDLIRCEDAVPGALRGEVFKQVLQKARERGLIKEVKPKASPTTVSDGDERGSQADKLVALCLGQSPVFFHDQHKTPFVRVNQANVNVTMPIRSRQFKTWLANLMWQKEEKVPGTEGLSGAMNTLEGTAIFNGQKYTLYNRVAPADDGIWLDICDDKWRVIKITAEGWRIIDDPPILFKRYGHQLPLIDPQPGGDPWRLLDFFNIDDKDENTRLTLLCSCISYLIPMIPHPIIVLYGIQGSGKTWLFKILRRLLDPSAIEVLTLPRDERERVQQLDHHWLAFYDNVTSIPWWMSDTLCRAATGGGFTKRELYTDDDDIIYNFKRCLGINGINIAAQRGDLLDRSVLVGLQNISNEKRKTEEQLLADFEGCKAKLLGGFLDTLVKAIKLYPTVNPKGLFRMADFTRWGCAIAIALGKTENDFLNAYESKVKQQIEEAAHASPVATVLLALMESLEKWDGAPTQLYIALSNNAKELGISTRQKAWPKAPHVLIRQLNELAPSLKSLGWEVTVSKSGSTRRIEVNSVPSVPSVIDHEKNGKTRDASHIHEASQASLETYGKNPSRDGRDAISTSSLGVLTQDNVEKVLNAVIEAVKVRGSAHTNEIVLECKLPEDTAIAILKQLAREGKLFSPMEDWWKVS